MSGHPKWKANQDTEKQVCRKCVKQRVTILNEGAIPSRRPRFLLNCLLREGPDAQRQRTRLDSAVATSKRCSQWTFDRSSGARVGILTESEGNWRERYRCKRASTVGKTKSDFINIVPYGRLKLGEYISERERGTEPTEAKRHVAN